MNSFSKPFSAFNVDDWRKELGKREVFQLRHGINSKQITTKSAENLSTALAENSHVKVLDLSFAQFTQESMKYFAPGVAKNTSLAELNLSGSPLGIGLVSSLCSALNENQTIHTLILSECRLVPKSIMHLSEVLKTTTTLHRLNLSHNNLLTQGIKYLSHGLEKNQSLEELVLSHSKLDAESMQYLCQGLAHNQTLKQLDLRITKLKTAGLRHLEILFDTNTCLSGLNLANNEIAGGDLPLLTTMISKGLRELDLTKAFLHKGDPNPFLEGLKESHIEKLNLSLCHPNCGLNDLGRILQCNYIQTLNLKSNSLEGKDIQPFVSCLGHCKTIRDLNLAENCLSNQGANELATALSNHPTLEKLNLKGNSIHSEGIQSLCGALKFNKHLQELILDENTVEFEGMKTVCEMLEQNNSIKILSMIHCHIFLTSGADLKRALSANTTLQELDLTLNEICEPSKLISALEDNYTLKKLYSICESFRYGIQSPGVIRQISSNQKKKRHNLSLLLCFRKASKDSLFGEDFLPLELFKYILFLSKLL